MSTLRFKRTNFDVLNRYRITLHQASELTERVKADLGLNADPAFIRLYQPGLENTLRMVKAQLKYWPDILERPYHIFYQQSDLLADIQRFDDELSRVVSTMDRAWPEPLLSTLDFAVKPFELNGRLKVLRSAAGYPFAVQVKQHVLDLWLQYDRAFFTTNDLYARAPFSLPRLLDFLEGAVDAYVTGKNLGRRRNDPKVVAVVAIIDKIRRDHAEVMDILRNLNEGYADLASFMSGALSEFKDLFASISIERFQEMIEGAMPRFEIAEEWIDHTKG